MPFATLDENVIHDAGVFIMLENELASAETLYSAGKIDETKAALRKIQIPKDAFQTFEGLQCLARTYHKMLLECGPYLFSPKGD